MEDPDRVFRAGVGNGIGRGGATRARRAPSIPRHKSPDLSIEECWRTRTRNKFHVASVQMPAKRDDRLQHFGKVFDRVLV